MEGEQKEPEKKPSWRDAYEPKDFKNDKVLAMISSGTLDKLNELAAKKSQDGNEDKQDEVVENDAKDDVLGNVIYRYALGSQASQEKPEILEKSEANSERKSPARLQKTIKAEQQLKDLQERRSSQPSLPPIVNVNASQLSSLLPISQGGDGSPKNDIVVDDKFSEAQSNKSNEELLGKRFQIVEHDQVIRDLSDSDAKGKKGELQVTTNIKRSEIVVKDDIKIVQKQPSNPKKKTGGFISYQQSSKKSQVSKEKRRENLQGASSLLCANYIAEKIESCSMKYNAQFGDGEKQDGVNLCDKLFQSCGLKCCSTGAFFLFLVYTAILICYLFYTNEGIHFSRIQNQRHKKFIADNLFMGAVVCTYYGYVMVQVQTLLVWLVFFVIQFLPCVYLAQHYIRKFADFTDLERTEEKDQDAYEMMWFWTFGAGIYLLFFLFALIKKDIKEGFGRKHGRIFLILSFVLGPFAMLGLSLYTILVSKYEDALLSHEIIQQLTAPIMLTLILTWLYFHFRFINVPPLHIENRLKEMEKKKNYDFFVNDRIGMAILKAKNQMSLLQKDSDSLGWFERFMLKIRKKAILWNSVLIGCGLILVEAMILAHGILKELEDDYIDNKPALYMSFWMFILIPYFMFSGIGIISTDSSCGLGCVFNSPVFAVALTVIMSFVREEYLDDEEFEWLRNFLVNAPLLSLMFWTTLKLFGTYDRDLMWYAASFFSICFFVPLYYIAPFRNYAWFGKGTEDNWFGDYGEVSDLLYDGLQIVGLVAFIVVLLTTIIYMIGKFPQNPVIAEEHGEEKEGKKSTEIDLQNLRIYDFTKVGRFINKMCLLGSIALFNYALLKKPAKATDDQIGMIIAMGLIAFTLYVCADLNIGDKIIGTEQVKEKAEGVSQYVSSNFQNEDVDKKAQWSRTKALLKLFAIIFFFLIIVNGVIGTIDESLFDALINAKQYDTMKNGYMYGSIVILIFCVFLYWSRTRFTNAAISTVPIQVVGFWVFVYFPFFAIMPSCSLFNEGNKEEVARFQRVLTSYAIFIALLALSFISIYFNLRLRRNTFIRKMYFITQQVKGDLKQIGVRSDNKCIALAYKFLLKSNPELLKEQLKNRKPIYWWKIPGTCDDEGYSKLVIQGKAYDVLNAKKGDFPQEKKESEQKAKEGCCSKLCKYILSDAKVTKVEGEGLSGSEYSDSDNDEMMQNQIVRQDTESEDEIEVIPEKPDPNAKRRAKWLSFRYIPIPPFIWEYLIYCDRNQRILVEEELQKEFLFMLFDEFAYGHEDQYDQRWMDYFWVKEFMKVHCIVPSPEIPDVMIDELYTTFCNPQERKSRKHRIKQDPIVWEKKFAEGKEPEPFTEFGDDWKADAKYRFVNFLTEIAKRKFQLSDPQSALNDLIRIYLFPLSLWNLKITKLKYVWTWDMVLYLLKWKFRDNPDFAHYFDPIILTQSSVEDDDDIREVPVVQAEEVEESSDEDSVYEYDVLLYLKEDIARRNKGFTKVHINPCRKCLKAIVLTCQKVFGLVYGILTVLPKYMCAKKKPDEKDKAFKAPRKVGKKEVMKYLKEEKGGKKYDHKQSPPWAVVVNILINSMIEADNDWAGRIREKTCPIFIMSCTNAIALIFKLLEYYTLASFAFKPESIWFHSQGAEVALNFNNGKMPFNDNFYWCFWVSVVIVVLYLIQTVINSKNQENGHLGKVEKTGRVAKFPHYVWMSCTFVNFVSQVGTVFILSSFLDSFVCDKELEPEVLYKERSILCYSSEHKNFMIFGGITCLVYYLLCSFTYPNMQFEQAGCDLKYDPTFIVILTQVKLLIAGLGSFFPDEGDIVLQASLQALLLIVLALYVWNAKPCKIYSFNIIDFGFYTLAAWICIITVITHQTGSKVTGYLCLILGLVVLTIFTVVYYFISRKAEMNCEQIYKVWRGGERKRFKQQQDEKRQVKKQQRRDRLAKIQRKYAKFSAIELEQMNSMEQENLVSEEDSVVSEKAPLIPKENEIIKGRLDLDDPASLDQKQIPEPPQTNKESTKKVKKVKKKKKKAKESDKSSSDDSDGDNMADLQFRRPEKKKKKKRKKKKQTPA